MKTSMNSGRIKVIFHPEGPLFTFHLLQVQQHCIFFIQVIVLIFSSHTMSTLLTQIVKLLGFNTQFHKSY